jgi:hypothetical protein
MDASLRRVGAPAWTAAELSFAEKLQKTLAGRNLAPVSTAQEIRR